MKNIFTVLFLIFTLKSYSQKLDLKLIPLENNTNSVFTDKIQINEDETLIKFYIQPIFLINGYTEATNYLCKNGICRILIENEDDEIIEVKSGRKVFKKLDYDFNKKATSEMYAFSSMDYNSTREEIIFDGVSYGIYIQQNSKSNTLIIYEPEYYKNTQNKSMDDLAKIFYNIFVTYFLEDQ